MPKHSGETEVVYSNNNKSGSTSISSKQCLLVVFISLLIDLIAFTLILPLMPTLLDYYERNDEVHMHLLLVINLLLINFVEH